MNISDQHLKLAVASCLFMLGLLSAIAPRFAMVNSQHWFSLGNMMSSGVLLGAGLIHQLPDAQETLNKLAGGYPWSGFICGSTFVLFLVLEESMHLFMEEWNVNHSGSPKSTAKDNARHSDHNMCTISHSHNHDKSNYHKHQDLDNKATMNEQAQCQTQHCHHYEDHEGFGSLLHGLYQHSSTNDHSYSQASLDDDHNDDHQHRHKAKCQDQITNECNTKSVLHSLVSLPCESNLGRHHHHEEHIELHLHGSAVSSLALMFALSIHSILAGFTLGLQPTDEAITTAVAIIAHKMFEGYALGSTLAAASGSINNTSFILMIIMYSLCTPMAIVCAVVMSDAISLNEIVGAILQAAVAGTFIYISIIEVGMKELLICRVQAGVSVFGVGKRLEVAKLFSFILGYAMMAIIALYV